MDKHSAGEGGGGVEILLAGMRSGLISHLARMDLFPGRKCPRN